LNGGDVSLNFRFRPEADIAVCVEHEGRKSVSKISFHEATIRGRQPGWVNDWLAAGKSLDGTKV